MTMQPTDTRYWVFQPVENIPHLRITACWRVYGEVIPGRSISWGNAPLRIVDAATAEHIRAYGELPKGNDHATD